MCGIAGILNCGNNLTPVSEDVLKTMRDTMIHRGPDGAGIWVSDDKRVGFGHRRLSIIDLSKSADQPMRNEDGTVWIVFNGEIYNHTEVRPELEGRGHVFKTDHSDTEVVLHAFEEWGPDCVHRFRGIFAFAIWDGDKRELFLFRDRIGVKPLYYTFRDGRFMFASEIKAILAHPGISRSLNERGFYDYLSFLAVPAPNTMFRDIMKLSCSCYMRVRDSGQSEIFRYWDALDYVRPQSSLSEEEVARHILEELRVSVRYRKVSDVPVGVFLSGGIDSSTNTVLFTEGETGTVKTFSIGYDKEYKFYKNEFYYARMISRSAGTRHYEKSLTMDDFIGFLPKLIYHQDEPIADPVCIPIYYVSKLARDNEIIVSQVGEGSDELFCGYPRWNCILRLKRLNEAPVPTIFKRCGLGLLAGMGMKRSPVYELLRRGAFKEPLFWGGAEAFVEEEKKDLLSPRLKRRFGGYASYEAIRPVESRFRSKGGEDLGLNWMTYLDLNIRLPELLLMRLDKMSMAASLEAREPFLDHRLIELVMSIPESLKTKNYDTKYILKKAVKGVIPDELINRPKQGFNVPVYEWFFGRLGSLFRRKMADFTRRTDIFDASYVRALVESGQGAKLWYVLNFMLWHERWIEGIDEEFN